MKKFWRILKIGLGVVAGVALLSVVALFALSSYRLQRRHAVPPLPKLALATDPVVLARGGHVATSFGTCTLCHGDDFGGKVYFEVGPLGIAVGPNLTRGQGGIGAQLTTDDWVRAIRHGVGRKGTSLIVMPSQDFEHLANDDLTALISYLKQVPPVDRTLPDSKLRWLGRALLAAGKLPVLTAEKTRKLPLVNTIDRRPSASYGLYLATVGGCRGCHRPNLAGGLLDAPGVPPASNLTRAGSGTWSEAAFVRLLRTGKRPNGTALHPVMPWQQAGMMTDDELRALWLYLRSVPPVAPVL